jgi:hypothetical protein
MADDDTLTIPLLAAAMNVGGSSDISGDGLDARPDDSLFTVSDEDRMVIAAMSRLACERGSLVITKDILARR